MRSEGRSNRSRNQSRARRWKGSTKNRLLYSEPISKNALEKRVRLIKQIFYVILSLRRRTDPTYYPYYGSLFAELYDTMAHRNHDLLMKGPLEGFLAIAKSETVSSMRFANNAIDYIRGTSGDPNPFAFPIRLMKEEGLSIYEDMGGAEVAPIRDGEPIPDTLLAAADKEAFSVVKFHVPAVHDRVFFHFMRLAINLKSGAHFTIQNLEQGPLLRTETRHDKDINARAVITKFDLALSPIQNQGYIAQKQIFQAFNKYSKGVAIALAVLSALALIGTTFTFTLRKAWRSVNLSVMCICLVLLSVFGARIVFYAVVDSTVFPINVERHLYAASVLVFPVIILVGTLLVRNLFYRTGKNGLQTSPESGESASMSNVA